MTRLEPLTIPGFPKPTRLAYVPRVRYVVGRFSFEPWPCHVCDEPDDPGPHPWRDNPDHPDGGRAADWEHPHC